ncbi:unannotated protein [freshwater metagenome]|uniref:Unannotated protein n=1 Tax=freshwater metagenome TaxID=449393 RepID=A0A6J7GWP4_9ZZZZ|nr:isochorismatase family protein [Actinomycetota bacterium]MSW62131.1 isochorismatase family protein [Actinomycetota bacterium]MSX89210.1 isochorismatase family protein [Actinomycetota bacterium]MSZ64557.1 isochorismatase family protein [Actinomycetota bacterium]MTA57947.1 isochorismatase family protein [Actinomycetota bacterium]
MSLFEERKHAALLVIDVQNNVVDGAFALETVVASINNVINKARAANVSVIWVQHSDEELTIGSKGWQIVPELLPLENEPIIRKIYRSSFESTELDSILESLNVDHLYISGAQSNNCIRHTCHAALERGYDITLISDGHTSTGYEWNGHVIDGGDVVNEQNDNFSNYTLPGRNAVALKSDEITF